MPAPEAEPELVIVKYGSILVKSPVRGCKVYVDEIYKGGTDDIIESIVAGEHTISCKSDDKTVSGSFQIRKNETLRLEARFDEGKLVALKETSHSAESDKKKPEQVKQEKPKKTVTEPAKAEQQNPAEDRRRTHLTVIRINYDVTDKQEIRVEQKQNASIVAKPIKKDQSGKYYRTKQGMLLCDMGPCELTWTTSFIYTDENGKTDALLLNWKQTVFNGITPAGTSRQDLECCLNGQCWKMQDTKATDTTQEFNIARYRLSWNKTSVVVRRADIMKEILDAGRSLTDY